MAAGGIWNSLRNVKVTIKVEHMVRLARKGGYLQNPRSGGSSLLRPRKDVQRTDLLGRSLECPVSDGD